MKNCELIDTQWDVNVIGCGLDRLNWNELIDTQWDVNAKMDMN